MTGRGDLLGTRPGKSGETLTNTPDGPKWTPPALSFSVLGVAVPYVRVGPINKHGNVHEDRAYSHWKSQVVDAAREAMARAGWKTTAAAVRCDVTIVLIRRPTKKAPKTPNAWPIAGKSVGDVDNLAKGPLDAMQVAGVYRNDAQVVSAVIEKRWQAPREEFAGAIVRVEVLE